MDVDDKTAKYAADLERLEKRAQKVARLLERELNGNKEGASRELGFAVLLFKFGGPGEPATCISNGERGDMIHVVEEWLAKAKARQ